MTEFVPFPEPKLPTDKPLVRAVGVDYVCSGCSGSVPDGVWLHENIKDGMVIGILARVGADGPVVHECGQVIT